MRERAYELEELPTIETDRLLLRPLAEGDAPAYFALTSHGPTMASYGLPAHTSVDQTRGTIATLARWFEQGRALRWAVCEKGSPDDILGDVGYWQFDLIRDRGELGVKVRADRAGRGVGTEIMVAVIDYGFEALGLRGVDANIAPANAASIRLAEKLGFVKVGVRPALSWSLVEEAWTDMVFLSLNADAWDPPRCPRA